MKQIVAAAAFPALLVSLALTACAPDTAPPHDVAHPAPPEPAADLVILGGTLLDMVADEAAPRPIRALVVRGGKIERIIEAGSGQDVPAAASTIDAAGLFILPGFFDAHVHFRPFLPDASIWKRASNYYGITSLFDTGPCGDRCAETGIDPNEWIRAYKDYMNSAPVSDGPTLYITGRRIQDLNGTHPLGVRLSSRAEIAAYLDELLDLGVDGVKVESTLPADLRAVVVEEAAARGLPVVGHSRDANESIAAGMTFIEHMWPITSSVATSDPGEKFNSPQHDYLLDLEHAPPLIEAMLEHGVYVNPTMLGRYGYFAASMRDQAAVDLASFEFGGMFSDLPDATKAAVRRWWARADEWTNERLERHRQGLENVRAFLRSYTEAGGRVLAATDSGEDKLVGIGLHREMAMLAEAGISPYRVLLGATRWPAEMAGKADSIGTLTPGKDADIVLSGADPTADIANSLAIAWVVNQGVVVRSPDDCSVIRPPTAVTCRR